MLPRLLILFTTTLSLVLCTVISHKQAGIRQHALGPGRALDSPSLIPLGPSTMLKPRVALFPFFMNAEWIVDHHDFTCMLPVGTAAAIMQDFYEDLAAFAATTLVPASPRYQIWLGQIMLEITAPSNFVVEWVMVQLFALDMLNLTKKGYTNTYQINFISRSTGTMITFSLYTGLLRAATGGGQ